MMEIGNLLFGNSRGNFSIDRDVFQEPFWQWLEKNRFDSYGYSERGDMIDENGDYRFENDTFVIRPYYWGDNDDIAEKPNFVFKPEDIQISWYKYPLRDAYCNVNLDIKDFERILECCENSLDDRLVDIEKW